MAGEWSGWGWQARFLKKVLREDTELRFGHVDFQKSTHIPINLPSRQCDKSVWSQEKDEVGGRDSEVSGIQVNVKSWEGGEFPAETTGPVNRQLADHGTWENIPIRKWSEEITEKAEKEGSYVWKGIQKKDDGENSKEWRCEKHWPDAMETLIKRLFFFLSFCLFLVPLLRHMEFPRLGVQSELQLPACATATATWDLSHVCDLQHSSWQYQILNPLSKSRDWTHNLMVSSQIR